MYLPPPNDKEFEQPPAGTHLAVCYRVIDLGTQEIVWQGKTKKQHKIMVSWELPEEKMSDGRPFSISKRYTWSMSEKAGLRQDLESWRGVPFTEADFGEKGFDIKKILGIGCLLTIVHHEKEGKRYANIKAIGKLMKGMQAPSLSNEMTYLWLHPERWEPSTFHKLSQGLQETIIKSPEYTTVNGGGEEEPPPADHGDYGRYPDMDEEPIPF